jgi:hypothetical protein
MESIKIHVNLVQLDKATQAVLDWTMYGAPRQCFNSLAKPNSDIGRELQGWLTHTTCKFNTDTAIECNDHNHDAEPKMSQPIPTHDTNTHTNLTHPHQQSTG